MFAALLYVGLIGHYVEFERMDGEDDVTAAGLVTSVADGSQGVVTINLANDDAVTILHTHRWAMRVFARSPWLVDGSMLGIECDPDGSAADAAATRYDDEHCRAFEAEQAERTGEPVADG
jgi:hypothetical protein